MTHTRSPYVGADARDAVTRAHAEGAERVTVLTGGRPVARVQLGAALRIVRALACKGAPWAMLTADGSVLAQSGARRV